MAAYHVIADKFVTLASEDWENDISQPAPDLHTAFRLLVNYYISEIEHFDDVLTSFHWFHYYMKLPIAPAVLPALQQAYQQLKLDNTAERNALPPHVFVEAARNWFALINGLEPQGLGDHWPVFRFKVLNQNGANLLPYNSVFENRMREHMMRYRDEE
eukprot:TRINITY_DN1795_c0_g3_i1.p1 TRINITY_DN1795_c0_g3~~TRINITY_DN1795_c0_g3_i1.p1  ORF type:complete len:158 (-),score=16.69 TRINITY_DN1795_c0_g3_i1:28-501(-)